MYKETLRFRLMLLGHSCDHCGKTCKELQFNRKFQKECGIKKCDGAFSTVDIQDPIFPRVAEKVAEYDEKGIAQLSRPFNYYWQSYIYDEHSDDNWYILYHTRRTNHSVGKNGLYQINASQMAGFGNAADVGCSMQIVSERFKKVVTENELTGLEFYWLYDRGKYQAMQWYLPVAQQALGRGISHPLFYETTRMGPDAWQHTTRRWKNGVFNFDNTQLKVGAHHPNPHADKMIRLFTAGDLNCKSHRRVLREYTPGTDFAFMWTEDDLEVDSSPNYFGKRLLCMNGRAKRILVENNVINEDLLEHIEIFDELPEWAEKHDGCGELPPPYFNGEFAKRYRKEEEKAWSIFVQKERPIAKPNIKRALKELRAHKKLRPQEFKKGTSKKKLEKLCEELPFVLPKWWKDLLCITNGGLLCDECRVVPVGELAEFHADNQKFGSQLREDFPDDLIHVAVTCCGDWFSLQVPSLDTDVDDCKVVLLDHEEGATISQEWSSIALFIEYQLKNTDE